MKRFIVACAVSLLLYQTAAAGNLENPKVQPGLVRWHASFEKACEASKKTQRPVLLFHLMGKLDEQFC